MAEMSEQERQTLLDTEPWWCWECANVGYFPADWDEVGDTECPCCGDEMFDHDHDAEFEPPCVSGARPWLGGRWNKKRSKWAREDY